jgi:GT2 family glycosyltransferase
MAPKLTKPLVSVVIPTYNRGWTIKEAVDSVLAQDFKDYELIVVDLWLPQKLSHQMDFFNSNPDAVINQTQELWIRNGVRVNPKKRHHKFGGMIFERSLALCLVSPSAVMIRKNIFEIIGGFDESLPACEDYDLWLRVSCRYPVHLIATPLIIKRGGHDDQLSKASGLDKFRIEALIKIIESDRLSIAQYKAAANILRGKCAIYANGCRKRGRDDEATYYEDLADKYALWNRRQKSDFSGQNSQGTVKKA